MKRMIATVIATVVLAGAGVAGFASSASADAVSYDAVVWKMNTNGVKYPQTKISVTPETTLTLPTLPTTCGTEYQGDVYIHSDAEAAWLSSTTTLAGPDGAQDGAYLAPGGSGVSYEVQQNDACPTPPPAPPAGLKCTVTGPAYAESGDLFAVKTAAGYQFTNDGTHKPVDLGFPASGNLQGFTSLTYADKNVVGNGIFFRFVLDLSADGGSAYNSFSVSGSNTVDQSSVAGVGSKAALLGKTVAQVAAAYPHNKIVAIFWETGSSYPAGDGALLTGYSGACGAVSFVDNVNPPAPPVTPQAPSGIHTGDVPVSPLYPASALLLGAGLVFAFRKRLAAKF